MGLRPFQATHWSRYENAVRSAEFPSFAFPAACGNVLVMRLYRRLALLALLALLAATPFALRRLNPWLHRQPWLVRSSWFTTLHETKENTSPDTSFSAAPPMQPVPIPVDSLIAR